MEKSRDWGEGENNKSLISRNIVGEFPVLPICCVELISVFPVNFNQVSLNRPILPIMEAALNADEGGYILEPEWNDEKLAARARLPVVEHREPELPDQLEPAGRDTMKNE